MGWQFKSVLEASLIIPLGDVTVTGNPATIMSGGRCAYCGSCHARDRAHFDSRPGAAGPAGSYTGPGANTGMNEPVVGWRLWTVQEGGLRSWAVSYSWNPGTNYASCLVGTLVPKRLRCESSPGFYCRCGFWGVWQLDAVLPRAVAAPEPPYKVLGLVQGFGTVAIHSTEGWRAEKARILCLFKDRPWENSINQRTYPGRPSLAEMVSAVVFGRKSSIPPPGDLDIVEMVAGRYNVPLLSLTSAASNGVLAEMGVPGNQIEAARRIGEMDLK